MSDSLKNPDTVPAANPFALATGSYSIQGERLTILISNAHRLLKARYRKSPLWSLVSDLTGHGSQMSAVICRDAGYDPHQQCGGKYLKATTGGPTP